MRSLAFMTLIFTPTLFYTLGCISITIPANTASKTSQIGPQVSDEHLMAIALAFEKENKYHKAQELYEAAFVRNPQLLEAHRRAEMMVAIQEKLNGKPKVSPNNISIPEIQIVQPEQKVISPVANPVRDGLVVSVVVSPPSVVMSEGNQADSLVLQGVKVVPPHSPKQKFEEPSSSKEALIATASVEVEGIEHLQSKPSSNLSTFFVEKEEPLLLNCEGTSFFQEVQSTSHKSSGITQGCGLIGNSLQPSRVKEKPTGEGPSEEEMAPVSLPEKTLTRRNGFSLLNEFEG